MIYLIEQRRANILLDWMFIWLSNKLIRQKISSTVYNVFHMDTSAGFKVVFEILFNFYFPSMLVLCLQLQSESEMIRSFEVLWCEETKQSHSCSHQSQPQSQLPNDPVRDFSSPPPRQLHSSPSESCPHLLLLSRLLPPRSPPPPSSPSPPLRCPCSARRGESGGRTLNQDFQNCTTNVSCIHINL